MRVRYYLIKKILFSALLCCALLGFNAVAFAQVYKSYDADGNVIFSDKPTQRSEEVEITKPNISDSFEIPPASPAAPPLETKPEAEADAEPVTQPNADENSADTNKDGRVSRREKEEQRKERRRKKREMEKAAEENKG